MIIILGSEDKMYNDTHRQGSLGVKSKIILSCAHLGTLLSEDLIVLDPKLGPNLFTELSSVKFGQTNPLQINILAKNSLQIKTNE